MGALTRIRSRKTDVDAREELFLVLYYGDSPTRLQGAASAIAAGFPVETAKERASQTLRKYREAPFAESLRAVGLSKPMMAQRLKRILEKGKDRDVLTAVRMLLSNLGEVTAEPGGTNIQVHGPTMVIVGATADKMAALKKGAARARQEQGQEQSLLEGTIVDG